MWNTSEFKVVVILCASEIYTGVVFGPTAVAEVRHAHWAPGLQLLPGQRDGTGRHRKQPDACDQPMWAVRLHPKMGGALLMTENPGHIDGSHWDDGSKGSLLNLWAQLLKPSSGSRGRTPKIASEGVERENGAEKSPAHPVQRRIKEETRVYEPSFLLAKRNLLTGMTITGTCWHWRMYVDLDAFISLHCCYFFPKKKRHGVKEELS